MSGVLALLLSFVLEIASLFGQFRQLSKGDALLFVLAVAAYLVHGAIGIGLLIHYQPYLSTTPTGAIGAVAALFGWFALGLHALFALISAIGSSPKPPWMTEFGIYDLICVLVIGTGLIAALR